MKFDHTYFWLGLVAFCLFSYFEMVLPATFGFFTVLSAFKSVGMSNYPENYSGSRRS